LLVECSGVELVTSEVFCEASHKTRYRVYAAPDS
jgi:hypothetical protein